MGNAPLRPILITGGGRRIGLALALLWQSSTQSVLSPLAMHNNGFTRTEPFACALQFNT